MDGWTSTGGKLNKNEGDEKKKKRKKKKRKG